MAKYNTLEFQELSTSSNYLKIHFSDKEFLEVSMGEMTAGTRWGEKKVRLLKTEMRTLRGKLNEWLESS